MNKNRLISLAKALIAIDTSHPTGQQLAQQYLCKWCGEMGLVCNYIPGTKALYIQTHPDANQEFAFVCHLDVVPAATWRTAFKPKIKNGYLYGRGSVDDKGPLAVCLEVLLHFRSINNINVSCLLTNDEETDNVEIEKVLEKKMFKPSFCLVADGGTHTIFDIGQKGIISLTATVTTSGGHSAFEVTEESAALQLLKFIDNLKTQAVSMPTDKSFKPTLINVSHIISEGIPYAMPTQATANLEIQFPPPQSLTEWLTIIADQKKDVAGLQIKINFTEIPHIVSDRKTLAIINQPQNKMITVGGVNLAKNLNKAGIPAVGHCPVEEYMGHCENERIKIEDFMAGFEEYVELIDRWQKQN